MTGCAYTCLAEQSRVDWRLPYEQRIHIGTTTATPRRNQPTLTSQPANQPANHPASQPASGSLSLPAVSSQPPGIARTTPSTRDWKPRGEGLRVSPRARQTGGGVCWWNYFAWQKLTPCLTLALSLSLSLSLSLWVVLSWKAVEGSLGIWRTRSEEESGGVRGRCTLIRRSPGTKKINWNLGLFLALDRPIFFYSFLRNPTILTVSSGKNTQQRTLSA